MPGSTEYSRLIILGRGIFEILSLLDQHELERSIPSTGSLQTRQGAGLIGLGASKGKRRFPVEKAAEQRRRARRDGGEGGGG